MILSVAATENNIIYRLKAAAEIILLDGDRVKRTEV